MRLRSSRRIHPALRCEVPLGLLSLGVYLATLAPSVTGYDSAELATGAYTLGIVHPTGYPLYLLLGYLFTYLPFGSAAYRVNLLSAVCGAITVYLTARLGRRLTGSALAGWVGGGLLAFSFSFWHLSVVAEVYTLHALFLAILLTVLHAWADSRNARWLPFLGLTFGLSLTNHVSGVLFAPAIAWILLRTTRWRHWPRTIVLVGLPFLLGLTPYAYFPLRVAANPPLNYIGTYYGVDLRTLSGLWWMISGQAYRFFAFGYDLAGYLRELCAFCGQLWRNFTPLGVLLGTVGLVEWLRRRHPLTVTTLLVFVPTVLFFAGYAVGDKATMYLAAYALWAVWVAAGVPPLYRSAEWCARKLGSESAGLKLGLGGSLSAVVLVTCLANWQWADMSQHREPETFARQAFSALAPDSMVVGQWSTAVILEYFQVVEGLRPDVQVFNRSRYEVAQYYHLWRAGTPQPAALAAIRVSEGALLERASRSRMVFALEYDPRLAAQYEYRPVGLVFELRRRPSPLQ